MSEKNSSVTSESSPGRKLREDFNPGWCWCCCPRASPKISQQANGWDSVDIEYLNTQKKTRNLGWLYNHVILSFYISYIHICCFSLCPRILPTWIIKKRTIWFHPGSWARPHPKVSPPKKTPKPVERWAFPRPPSLSRDQWHRRIPRSVRHLGHWVLGGVFFSGFVSSLIRKLEGTPKHEKKSIGKLGGLNFFFHAIFLG